MNEIEKVLGFAQKYIEQTEKNNTMEYWNSLDADANVLLQSASRCRDIGRARAVKECVNGIMQCLEWLPMLAIKD